jgi:LPPG:FO 2-phospho-L-lactate transferase
MITLLSGGTGTPKLLQGLLQVVDASEIAIIVNTAEDKWLPHGYFSPDIDTVVYTLAGVIDDTCWHGIKGDTFHTHDRLVHMGFDEYLKIGDMDRATHILRGEMMKKGLPLSRATKAFCQYFGISAKVLPMSDDPVNTVISTPGAQMDLHEYLIKNRGEPEVEGIEFSGIEKARALPEALDCIRRSERVIIGPSNPITSISPILGVNGMREALRKRREECVAVSPIISGKPVSGPADRFLEAWDIEPTSAGVAGLYSDIISSFVVDEKEDLPESSEAVEYLETNTFMRTAEDKRKLAEFLV